MNHDETNSKPDPKPEVQAWIEPELEARVVAWVAGEASAFEISELERLVAEKPELGIFKRRIEAVHGLVGAAVRPDQEPMRMAEERRAKLLGTISAATPAGTPSADGGLVALPEPRKHAWWSWRAPQIYLALSGAVAAGLVALISVSREDRRPARPDPSLTVVGLSPGGSPQATPPTDARFENAPAQETITLSPFTVEQKPKWSSRLREGARRMFSDGREKAQNEGQKSTESNFSESDAAAIKSQTLIGPSPGGAPQVTPPVAVHFGAAQATPSSGKNFETSRIDSITPSAPAAPRESKDDFVGGKVGGGAGGRIESRGQAFRDAPDKDRAFSFGGSPQPSSTVLGATHGGITVPSDESRKGGGAGLPVPVSPDPNIRLDAFGVSAERQEKAAAITDSVSAPAPFNNKLGLIPPSGLSEGSKSSFGQTASSAADGRAAPDRSSVSSSFGESATLRATGGVVLSSLAPKEKQSDLLFKTVTETGAGGDKKASEVGASDLPLLRLRSFTAPDDSLRAELAAATAPESTFSLHVSDVSFRLAQAALMRGEKPDPARIRPEEFYNAFDYGDPAPANAEKIGARIEQSAHPFLQERNLVRIAMKVPATGRGAGQSLRLTVLLDTSGSMEREDRAASVRRALQELIALLGPNDRITLIGFARQPRLLAEGVPGNQAGSLVDLIARTPSEGGTNLEEALKLGGELARRHALPGAQNRIVVVTDGAANLGDADPEHLARAIATFRQQGIAFDACGVGLDGLDDAVLEALTRKGDGRYYVLNSPNEADTGFARQLAGSLRPAAENVKLQVRFNSARVGHYRLIGFEQHRLRSEDFRNDQVDAAELAAEEAAVALYQVEVLPQGSGELGEVFVRFRDAATGAMIERSWALPYEPQAPRFERATPSMQLAGMAALLAEKLAGNPVGEQFKLGDLASVATRLRGQYAHEPRVQELVRMFEQMRRLRSE